jgi:hypothetical protein
MHVVPANLSIPEIRRNLYSTSKTWQYQQVSTEKIHETFSQVNGLQHAIKRNTWFLLWSGAKICLSWVQIIVEDSDIDQDPYDQIQVFESAMAVCQFFSD